MPEKVLVVEDDQEINELVGAYVEIAGFDYLPAHDAASAVREAQKTHPSLIVLDLMLPDADGFEVCRRLKSEPETRDIPVLMLTALEGEEERRKGKECGVCDYMTKPFDPDRLMSAIKGFAHRGNGHARR
jgi:DNA-binding response OmpR family regulator